MQNPNANIKEALWFVNPIIYNFRVKALVQPMSILFGDSFLYIRTVEQLNAITAETL